MRFLFVSFLGLSIIVSILSITACERHNQPYGGEKASDTPEYNQEFNVNKPVAKN